MFDYSLQKLESGLSVLTVPMAGSNSITVLCLANTGSRYETPQQHGIAHFFEHMVFKGTAGFPQAQDLAVAVDSIGADFNAFTSKEYTGYYVKAASRHLDLALDVVSDMILTPQLRQDDIDREKGVIVEEINMYHDTPPRYVSQLFDRMFYAETGIGHDIIGSKETVTALKTADFKQFLSQWYGLPNLVVVVAGDEQVVSQAKTIKQVEKMFGKAAGERATELVDVRSDLDGQHNSKQRLHLETRQTEQAHFILGWPEVSRHQDERYALTLLSAILGDNMSSRLFTEVREKRGLAYYVGADSSQYHDLGDFGARAGVDPSRIDQALEVTIDQFTAVADGSRPITEGELARAKEYIAGKMALQYEDPQAVAQYYGMKQLLTGKVEKPDEALAKLKAIELDEIQELAEKIIQPGQLRLAVIGSFKDEAQFEKYLV